MSSPAWRNAWEELSEAQQDAIRDLLKRWEENGWSQRRFEEGVPGDVARLGAALDSEDDLARLGGVLQGWVRWKRLPGYYLSFVYQKLAFERQSPSCLIAALLYGDAQVVAGDPLALSTWETLWAVAARNFGGAGTITARLAQRLQTVLEFYERFRRRLPFAACNPLAEHLYSYFSQQWMREAQQDGADDEYARIVSCRFAGLKAEAAGAWEEAREQYEKGLRAARQLGLEAEIGQLLRHLGFALRKLGRLNESVETLAGACRWEAAPVFAYWQALSENELGLSLKMRAGSPEDIRQSREAFRRARRALEMVFATAMPEVRDVGQELARVFSENALEVALRLGDVPEALATIEACGPRQVSEAVWESLPEGRDARVPLTEYRRVRNAYYRQVHAYGSRQSMENYLAALAQNYPERKGYLLARQTVLRALVQAHDSDLAVRSLLEDPPLGYIFVFIHVGAHGSWVVAADLDARAIAAEACDHFTARDADAAYEAFRAACLETGTTPGDDSVRRGAVDDFLKVHQAWLMPPLARLLAGCKGRRVKFFLREGMNPVPVHALPWEDGRMRDAFEISYGQTLAVWRWQRKREQDGAAAGGVLAVDAGRLPFYRAALVGRNVLEQPSWEEFLRQAQQQDPAVVLFACHGQFDPTEPGNSRLLFGGEAGVSFYQIFAELRATRWRGVVLGACDSGLRRSRVSAESVGLQLAFLAAGAKNVVAAQWPVNQLSTALLMDHLLNFLPGLSIPQALARAEAAVERSTAEEVADWLELKVREWEPRLTPHLAALLRRQKEPPFAHPYYWAGFTSMGSE